MKVYRFYTLLYLFLYSGLGALAAQTTSITEAEPTLLTSGHEQVRAILGSDIGSMVFNTPRVNQFRNYLYNSQLTTSTGSYSKGSYSQSSGRIILCPDGSFVQILSGMVSLDVEGASAYSGGTDSSNIMPGIWEVAEAQGILYILFYSTHPSMLEDSPNGFMPLPVQDFQEDILLLFGEDHYRRGLVYDCGQ